MKALYIGILSPGSTSRMRAETLKSIAPEFDWVWIDTDEPFSQTGRLSRSLAFRANSGPAVDKINRTVNAAIDGQTFDLVWIDKAVFLNAETTRAIRRAARRMIHFTPDTAFHSNRSRHFENSMSAYDLLVTTKSFESAEYRERVGEDRFVVTSQGFDETVHNARTAEAADWERQKEAVFVGLAEQDREDCISTLLTEGVPIRLAGHGWRRFLRKWGEHPLLTFVGTGVFGPDYARMLSSSWVGLGLLSKRFPELHTTRTFEIPACGTALATEKTADTSRFFGEDDVIFFSDYDSLAKHLKALFEEPGLANLRRVAANGHRRVLADDRSYQTLLKNILEHPRVKL